MYFSILFFGCEYIRVLLGDLSAIMFSILFYILCFFYARDMNKIAGKLTGISTLKVLLGVARLSLALGQL